MAEYERNKEVINAVQYTGENLQELWDAFGTDGIQESVRTQAPLFRSEAEEKFILVDTIVGRQVTPVGDWVFPLSYTPGKFRVLSDQHFKAEFSPSRKGTSYVVDENPKMLRETLATAQSMFRNMDGYPEVLKQHRDVLQKLIDECDRHRPLGPNGNHGVRHTETCGCFVNKEYGE